MSTRQIRLTRLVLGSAVTLAFAFGVTACASETLPAAPHATQPTVSPSASALPPSASPSPSASTPGDPSDPAIDPPATIDPGTTAVQMDIVTANYDPALNTISAVAQVTDYVTVGGTCQLTVRQGSTTLEASAQGEPSAQVTYCAGLSVALPSGASGDWEATVSFTADVHSGTTTTTVSVQ